MGLIVKRVWRWGFQKAGRITTNLRRGRGGWLHMTIRNRAITRAIKKPVISRPSPPSLPHRSVHTNFPIIYILTNKARLLHFFLYIYIGGWVVCMQWNCRIQSCKDNPRFFLNAELKIPAK